MPTTFFDTETTDKAEHKAPHTDNRQPDIVQLAAIMRDDDGREMNSINLILTTNRRVEAGALRTHGITNEMSKTLGVSPVNGIYVFRDMVAMSHTVVAHNIAFDRKVVNACLFRNEVPLIPWELLKERDTMLAGTNVCKIQKANGQRGWKWPSLAEIYWYFFEEKIDGAHDALVDVRACMRVYDELVALNAFAS